MKKANNTRSVSTFFKVLKYLKVYRLHFTLSLLFTALSVALTLYVPILVGNAIDLAIGKGNVDFDGISEILLKILAHATPNFLRLVSITKWPRKPNR